ncbi:MAG: thiamine phosphate synthase [Alphaproteobacteria bacterium]
MYLQCLSMVFRNNFDLSVYFIADSSVCRGRRIEHVVASALKGGVTMVQLRNKTCSREVVMDEAKRLQDILADSSVPLIINDYVELAAEIGADGVHIGQGDMKVEEARNIIGDDAILGVTAFTNDHYSNIDFDMVDYLGTGPFYPTLTKPDKQVMGAKKFAELVSKSLIPVVGIGGITPDNARDVISSGADGVAMMRAISNSSDPETEARKFVESVCGAR